MATYRFRIIFDDHDDITRDIEIKSTQTFEDLHYAIHNSIGFDASKPASFYMSDDNWKKGKEISTRILKDEEKEKIDFSKNSRLCDYIIDPHQKIFYIFDFSAPWSFRIELVKISREETSGITYPRCVKTVGEAPKQYGTSTITTPPVVDEFEIDIDEDLEIETDETEELGIEESELPESVEKDTFLKAEDDSADNDFETAEEDAIDDEGVQEKDDF